MCAPCFFVNKTFHLRRKQEAPPEKKAAGKAKGNKQYGGPGSFIPTSEHSNSSILNSHHPSRVASTGSVSDYSRPNLDGIPPSLRASSSLATLDLYVPPYEQQRQYRSPIDQLTNEFGEFGVATSHRRRESFPVCAVTLCFIRRV